MAVVAEEQGFDAYFRSDHFLPIGGDGLPGPSDSWVTLAGLARETSRVRLGTLVTSATFRHPGLLAVEVAEVDAMSGGRVELGLGAGWYDAEHRAHGVPFAPIGERFERLEEQLEIITGMWATPVGEHYRFSGRHYELVDCPALPKPAQQPRPPVIMGGAGSSRTPRLAARFADEFNTPFFTVSDARQQYQRVTRACQEAGRDPGDMVFSAAVTVCCAKDPEELERRASATGRTVDDLRRFGAAGTPEDVADRVLEYEQAGASTLYLQVLDIGDLDHVRLLGTEVLPRFA